jgi:hypothetical protein
VILVRFEALANVDVIVEALEVVAMLPDPGVPHGNIAANQVRVFR